MSITAKTRKALWAKSGNHCSICKIELFSSETGKENLNIGEECHIISEKKGGPRHKTGAQNYDGYGNLILLCRNHHKEIDELTETFSEEVLRYIKQKHENWVQSTLKNSIKGEVNENERPRFLSRITSGKELFNTICYAHGYRTDYDDPKNEEEAEYIGGVIQTICDLGDLSEMVEVQDHVKMGIMLSRLLEELEEKGFFLFAEDKVEFNNNQKSKWKVATILIRRITNPDIVTIEQ